MWWIIAGVFALGAGLWAPISSNVEKPKYKVLSSNQNIEIREYPAMIVAETDVVGERDKAIREGFRIIADYIFGNNLVGEEVAMTAPVTQQPSKKISMTAPVMQQGGEDSWQVRFVMPAIYTLETLPTPKNPAVMLRKFEVKRFAVIRFSGFAGEVSLKSHTDQLKAFLQSKNIRPQTHKRVTRF